MLARLFPAGGNLWRLLCNKPETGRGWTETERSPLRQGHEAHSLSGAATCPPVSGQMCRWGERERGKRSPAGPRAVARCLCDAETLMQTHSCQMQRDGLSMHGLTSPHLREIYGFSRRRGNERRPNKPWTLWIIWIYISKLPTPFQLNKIKYVTD